MDDHEIQQAIYGLMTISAVFAAALAAGVLVQSEGSELFSWSSRVQHICSWLRD